MKDQLLASGIDFLVERAKAPGYNPFYGATALVLVSADAQLQWIQLDCGAAENIALAAEALGIGSCVMVMPGRLFASDESGRLARELGIPDGYSRMVSVALGYREGECPMFAWRRWTSRRVTSANRSWGEPRGGERCCPWRSCSAPASRASPRSCDLSPPARPGSP